MTCDDLIDMAEAVLLADRSTLVVEVEEGRVEVSGGEGEEVEQGLGGELKVTLLLGRLWGDWSEPPAWCLISGLLLASGGGGSSAGSGRSGGVPEPAGGLGAGCAVARCNCRLLSRDPRRQLLEAELSWENEFISILPSINFTNLKFLKNNFCDLFVLITTDL